ncbi:MAG: type III pantothenate kinase [Candidatus Omnitrophota bacterium]|jgi:type III pantothenate kinase
MMVVDVGNTNISLGVFRGKLLIKRLTIPTGTGDYRGRFKRIIGRSKVDDIVICSVVPSAENAIVKQLISLTGKRPYIIGKQIKVPIRNLYRKPRQVGQDRLVNAYAGVRLHGAPLVIVDFGTTVTFDVVSARKEYLGGMIIPGLGISLESLNQRTALLPKIKLEEPAEFIGRDTRNSMLSGIVYGFAALTDNMVTMIRKKIGSKAKVVATGGSARMIFKYCRKIDKIDEDLTIKGLKLIMDDAGHDN